SGLVALDSAVAKYMIFFVDPCVPLARVDSVREWI
ncbi:MAG: hypothetical protein JWQ58_702, partial [Reyranella sp.]|nr:hypothetical protein [Reyranella sp.]